jgi:hypothetical protein
MGLAAAAAISGVAAIGAGAIAAGGAKKAGRVQAEAADKAQLAQERMFQEQKALQEPFRQAGLTAQEQIMQLLGIGGDATAEGYGSLAKPFGQTDFEQDPGYAFRQAEGMRALERSASARGNLLSGGTLRGIQRFGQDLASQEYGNAFNRYQIERNARLNPLQSLMGSGQSATNVLTGAAGQAGQNEASNIYNAAQARASSYIGQANALGGALGSIGQAAASYPLMQAQMNYFNSLAGGGGGGGGVGVGTAIPGSSAPFYTPNTYMPSITVPRIRG